MERDSEKSGAAHQARSIPSSALDVLTGAFASDALLVPGLARISGARRSLAMTTIAAAGDDASRVSAALSAEAVALRVNGRALVVAPEGILQAEYVAEASGGIEAWFTIDGERHARGAVAAIAALASLAAATAYAVASRGGDSDGNRTRPESSLSSRHIRLTGTGASRHSRPRDVPAGTEELAGILGKHAP